MEIWLNSSGLQSQFDGKPSWGEEGGREGGGTPVVSDPLMSLSNQPNCRTPSGFLVRVLHRQLPSELSTIFMINESIRKMVRSGRISFRWTSVVVLFFSALFALKLRGTPENLLLAGNTSTWHVCLRAYAQLSRAR